MAEEPCLTWAGCALYVPPFLRLRPNTKWPRSERVRGLSVPCSQPRQSLRLIERGDIAVRPGWCFVPLPQRFERQPLRLDTHRRHRDGG